VTALAERYKLYARKLIAGAAGISLLLAVLTVNQIGYWRDTESLFAHSVEVTGPNALASYILATMYALKGDTTAALQHYSDTCRVKPDHAAALAMRSLLYHRAGKFADAQADAQRALDLLRADANPDRNSLNTALFILAEAKGREGHLNEAESLYRAALQYRDEWEIHHGYAVLLARLGRPDEAVDQFNSAIALYPQSHRTYFALGTTLSERGDWEHALVSFVHAVRLNPKDAKYRSALGVALLALGRTDDAAREARLAARLDQGWLAGSTRTAWAMATDPEPARRWPESAARLCALLMLVEAPSAELLDARAAAEAACGRFEEAARLAAEANQLAQRTGRTALADGIRRRMTLYQNRQCYTEPPGGK
jgi:Flp pilus assembly protein TadD